MRIIGTNTLLSLFAFAYSISPSLAADCTLALQQHIVCAAASTATVDEMLARQLEAITVMQDVATDCLVLFAASDPAKFDISTEILPLSLSKLILAASWWDRKQSATTGPANRKIDLRELISAGTDSPAKARRLPERADAACSVPHRILDDDTSQKLIEAMLDTVRKGTAKGIAASLTDVAWTIGGKTGTSIRAGQPVNEADGCFAGLVFDPGEKARFTVVTYVRHGGYGGVNAAEISAITARRLALSTP